MFKKLILSLFVLHMCYIVSARKCNDCQLFYDCPGAFHHIHNLKNNETKKLTQKALCGKATIRGVSIHKVCCSDFPRLEPQIESRWTESNKENLLPDKCGSIMGNRIVGGKIARLYEFPWMVLISYKNADGERFGCGGTIINSKYILTAAHCVVDKKITSVRIGEYDTSTDKDCDYETNKSICEEHIQNMSVEESIPHENYRRNEVFNDIALLRVNGEILFNYTNVEPICLPLSSLRNKTLISGTVAGWGRYTASGPESSVLLKVEVPVKTEAECKAYYNGYGNYKIKKQFCAGELYKDSCGGDSGGPLMAKAYYRGLNSYVQYGIVSYGPIHCGSALPGVYTDVREYVDWILDNIRE